MSNLSDRAIQICESRYFLEGENEDWEKCTYRVADHISSYENEKPRYREKFHEILNNLEFIPAGRILRNSGRTRGSLLNCHAMNIEDNMRSILKVQMEAGLLWADGSGVGFNISSLRPHGDRVNGPGGETSGPVSFLKAYDALAATIQTGGSRRAAALACLDVSHPDIDLFLSAKLIDGVLPHFNISINITNGFLEAVEGDKPFDLTFNQKVYKTINARELWGKIIVNMLNSAEPGLLNISNMYRSNSYYFQKIVSPNPCQPGWATLLSPNGIVHISDVKIGDKIWSEDGWVTVTNKVCAGVKEVFKYETNLSVFYGTENHRVMSSGVKVEVNHAESIDPICFIPDKPSVSLNLRNINVGRSIGTACIEACSCTTSQCKAVPIIPPKYLYCNFDDVCSFLYGLFSVNSTVNSLFCEIKFNTNSLLFARQLQLMLSAIGILSSILTESYIHSVIISDLNSLTLFNTYIGFERASQQSILQEILTSYVCVTPYVNTIQHKKYVSTEQVFDITVDGEHHTYWTGGCNVSNCSELPLPHAGSCCLGSLVLPKFLTLSGKTNWKRLEDVIYYAVRFLDNVIDINRYTLPEIESVSKAARRIGIGYMGVAEYLFAKQLRYGSKEALDELEKLWKNIRNYVYQTLVKLAQEKGAFPEFEPVAYGKADFIRSLPASLRKDIKKHGSRCCTAISVAPNGTIALIPEVTGGIEPLFAKAYLRKDRVGERMYIASTYETHLNSGVEECPNWLVDSYDLTPEDHLETQSLAQKFTDSAISKTVNVPKDTTPEQLSDLLLEYTYDLKGVTVYRDGSKKGQVLNRLSHQNVLDYINKKGKVTSEQAEEHVAKCRSGVCEL